VNARVRTEHGHQLRGVPPGRVVSRTTRGYGVAWLSQRHNRYIYKTSTREVPLVLIGALDRQGALPLAAVLRGEGAVVLIAEGDGACLRVATSVSPDIVLLDPRLSHGLLSLLRAHPFSNSAQISWSRTLASVPALVPAPA
jgi:hypothetical protein